MVVTAIKIRRSPVTTTPVIIDCRSAHQALEALLLKSFPGVPFVGLHKKIEASLIIYKVHKKIIYFFGVFNYIFFTHALPFAHDKQR